MDKQENPIDLIYTLKDEGFLVMENEGKVRLALCGFGRLVQHLLSPEGIQSLEKAELYAKGELSKAELSETFRKYQGIPRSLETQNSSWEEDNAHNAIVCALLTDLNAADFHDYLGYCVAFCRRADKTITDAAYSRILRDVFSYEG